MAESFPLPELPRGTLPDPDARLARLVEARPLVLAAVEGETDPIAIQATLACVLWHTFAWANWCGFYRRVSPTQLSVGPYQGSLGCLHIALSRGVCGAAAREGKTQVVPDVDAFPGHIACDSASRSELVVPIFDASGEVRAVLDVDSPRVGAFTTEEARVIEGVLAEAFRGARW